jgi:5-formyltetrahydrofolate cyclo-ligase
LIFDPEIEALFRHQAKAALRKRARAVRRSIPESARAARADKLVERVIASAPFERAKAIGLFYPMIERGEVDVRPLNAAARARGKVVAYPFLKSDSEMTLLCAAAASLEERGYGFAEPPEGSPEVAVNDELLIVVPALAVDPSGQRIGYGKGFYDRLLARMRPPAYALAVVYDFEVISEVPATELDQPVDMVVTDVRSFAAEKR